jgi:hypothetical protein
MTRTRMMTSTTPILDDDDDNDDDDNDDDDDDDDDDVDDDDDDDDVDYDDDNDDNDDNDDDDDNVHPPHYTTTNQIIESAEEAGEGEQFAPNNQMEVGVCCGVDMVEEARLQVSAVTMHNACTQQSNGSLCLLSNRYGRGGKLPQSLMTILMT